MTKAAVVNPNRTTYVFFILDKSGSMGYCLNSTIRGFNEQIQTVKSDSKEDETGKWYASLITFNQKVHAPDKLWCCQPDDLQELTEENYVPNGSTAMLDAVGITIERIKADTPYEDEDVSYLIVIVSDGDENASKKYDRHENGYARVGEMIQELQSTNRFTFTYLGSNQDLGIITSKLHIPAGNTALYDSDEEGTEHAFAVAAGSTKTYMRSRGCGMSSSSNSSSCSSSTSSFYSADDKTADLTKVTKK